LTHIVHAQHYTRITARQEVGNKALPCRSPTGHRFFRTVAARSLALDGDANSRPSAYESEASYKSAPSRVTVETRLLRPRGRFSGELLPGPACSELGYRWFDQPLEVGVTEAHGVGMGARPEYYRFIFR
jgi:hypothetical protein